MKCILLLLLLKIFYLNKYEVRGNEKNVINKMKMNDNVIQHVLFYFECIVTARHHNINEKKKIFNFLVKMKNLIVPLNFELNIEKYT